MSLFKGHYLRKVYVQILVQRVHNWIHQSAVAHLGTQGTHYELTILQWNPWCQKEHHQSSCYHKPSPFEVCSCGSGHSLVLRMDHLCGSAHSFVPRMDHPCGSGHPLGMLDRKHFPTANFSSTLITVYSRDS